MSTWTSRKMPSMIPLEKGITIKGRVVLPRGPGAPSDAQFTVEGNFPQMDVWNRT